MDTANLPPMSVLLRATIKRFSGEYVPDSLLLSFPGGVDDDGILFSLDIPLARIRTIQDVVALIANLTRESWINSFGGVPALDTRDGPDCCAPQLFW